MADQASGGMLSPFLSRERFRRVQSYVRGRVLDFGCGTGDLCVLSSAHAYCGVEPDAVAFNLARRRHPGYRFERELPAAEYFDTILVLAVIEHLADPVSTIRRLVGVLAPDGHLVVTTPAPIAGPLHRLGARLGLFSAEAAAEHKRLFDRRALETLASQAQLSLVHYERFLLGMNQRAVFRHRLGFP